MILTRNQVPPPTVDPSAVPRFVWPLAPTALPDARLSWAAWIAEQLATCSHPRQPVATAVDQRLPARRDVVIYLSHETSTRLAWPLPATQLPNAHLSWSAWLEVQARGTNARQPQRAVSMHAA